MICPRWNRHANALLASLSGSSRTVCSQHCLRRQSQLSRGNAAQRRGFSSEGEGGVGVGGGVELPSRQQLDEARQELLKIGRPKSRSPASNTQHPLHQLKRESKHGRWHTGVENGRKYQKADAGRKQRDATGHDGAENAAAQQEWPQLKRRSQQQMGVNDEGNVMPGGDKLQHDSSKGHSGTSEKDKSSKSTNSSRLMLVIDGLSPNLNARDFYRLAPNDLSKWKSVIKKVQQHRNPKTLEPLGRYLVTFSSSEAAASYRDKLLRLHQLSSLRCKSASGLWESTVPSSLKIAFNTATDDAAATTPIANNNLSDLVDTFTLAPGSQDTIGILRARVAVKRSWAHHLAKLVEPLGYGEKPPVLLLDVYPPTLTAEELLEFIRLDGHNRGLRWRVCAPLHLKSATANTSPMSNVNEVTDEESQEQDEDKDEQKPSFRLKDHDTSEKLKRRFVLACADEAEARRFQRNWNNRALNTSRPRPGRYIVHASIINW